MQSFSEIATGSEKTRIDKFIGACLQSVAYAHSAHFATKSYAKHMAYEYFYEEMPGAIDAFVETYIAQGHTYREMLPVGRKEFTEILKTISSEAQEISNTAKNSVTKTTADDIQQVCLQTMYKLGLS
ncbi:starvation-inducible transcriptional regulator [Aeromonas phage GomatiRiver_11]|nr:hypothetical protein OBDJBBDK_00151 [Aeromonas phage AhFM11]WKW84327.1 starvation-inducible transcriptional regulator [Aeromonas phage GomatiRiver_11]